MSKRRQAMFAVLALVALVLSMGVIPAMADNDHHEGHEHAHDEEVHEDAPLGHGHTEGGMWSEAWYILTDPAHWIAEFAAELVFFFTIHFWIMERVIHKHRVSRRGNILHEEVSG